MIHMFYQNNDNNDSNPQDIFMDENDSSLWEYCEQCGKDITLLSGVEDGLCSQCQEDE